MSDPCCYVDDYEPAQLARIKKVKARKLHTCTECGRDIPVGEKYEYGRLLFEGVWSTSRTCWFCCALVRDYCGGIQLFGGLAELLADCLSYNLQKDEFFGA